MASSQGHERPYESQDAEILLLRCDDEEDLQLVGITDRRPSVTHVRLRREPSVILVKSLLRRSLAKSKKIRQGNHLLGTTGLA